MLNLVGFNFAWFGLVYWGNNFIPISLLLLLAHVRFMVKVSGEVKLILTITLIGIFVDSLLQYFTVFIFSNTSHIPLWLMTLWACFGATVCHSLRFLASSKVLQILVGALLAPFSYLAGHKLQAVEFGQTVMSTYLILGLVWGLLFVLFFALKETLVKVEVKHV